MPDLNHTADAIRKILLSREPKRILTGKTSFRHAGVLIPLVRKNGAMAVLLTKRTDNVEHHKGQISFPGGAVDAADATCEETALRETQEEIGLAREQIDILGQIDDTLTVVSSFIIHPYVGLVNSVGGLRMNPAEVERILEVPLSVFHPYLSAVTKRTFPYEGKPFQAPGYEYRGEFIWGATARIMDNLMHILADKIRLPASEK